MAKNTKSEQLKPAELTEEKISRGIINLKRRIRELEEFDPSAIEERADANAQAITRKINETIAEIFGYDTIKYKNYHIWSLDTLPITLGVGRRSSYEIQEGYRKGVEGAIIKLKSLIESLEEKKEDMGGYLERYVEDTILLDKFWDDIHPKIASIARSRYDSKHYADAVEAALKDVNNCVKDIAKRKTGKELDGAPLMHTAFSLNSPIIVLDDLSNETGRNIQQGYMEIFAGAMIGIRNPKAHSNVDLDKIRAKHFLYLASLLMQKIDERI